MVLLLLLLYSDMLVGIEQSTAAAAAAATAATVTAVCCFYELALPLTVIFRFHHALVLLLLSLPSALAASTALDGASSLLLPLYLRCCSLS